MKTNPPDWLGIHDAVCVAASAPGGIGAPIVVDGGRRSMPMDRVPRPGFNAEPAA